MTSIIDVCNAWRSLIPAGSESLSWEKHAGQAPVTATAPWVVSGFDAPEVSVSEAASVSHRIGVLRLTIAALTSDQAVFIDEQMSVLIGKKVAVDGYQVGALMPGPVTGPYPAGMNATDTDLRFQVIRRELMFTYSKTP